MKIKLKQKKISRKPKIYIISVFVLIIIFSSYCAYAINIQPTKIEEITTLCRYGHDGRYDYCVYIKNSSLFDTDFLLPGQENYFKKIIDHIDASYTYQFDIDKPATIQGTYVIKAYIQTNLWSKDFIIIPKTSFNNTKKFTVYFPINISYFDEIIDQIDRETTIGSQDQIVTIKCDVNINARTSESNINESFAPSLNLFLERKIIKFEGDLSTSRSDSIKTIKTINRSNIPIQRNAWTFMSIIFIVMLVGIIVFTTSSETKTTIDRMIKKIQKKHGDWIVDIENEHVNDESKEIYVKKFDDLIKISEEIGKPIFHYTSPIKNLRNEHSFFIIDESSCYKHVISNNKKIKKSFQCPECGNTIEYELNPGDKKTVICPKCGSNGIVSFDK